MKVAAMYPCGPPAKLSAHDKYSPYPWQHDIGQGIVNSMLDGITLEAQEGEYTETTAACIANLWLEKDHPECLRCQEWSQQC